MSYTRIPTRADGVDDNQASDINQLQDNIDFIGGEVHTVTNANYTSTDDDGYGTILFSTGNTTRTWTLPTASDNADRILMAIKTDSGTGDITIDGEGSEEINGATTQTIDKQYGFICVRCDGTAWFVLSTNIGSVIGSDFILAGGSNPFTADQSMGGNSLTNSTVKVLSVTGGSTITDAQLRENDIIEISSTGTITLPTLADNYGYSCTFMRTAASSSTPITFDGEGSETINGKTNDWLYQQGSQMTLFSSQTRGEWVYLGRPWDPSEIELVVGTDQSQGSPSTGIFYNIGSNSIEIPPGDWLVEYYCVLNVDFSTAGQVGSYTNLSPTAGSGAADGELESVIFIGDADERLQMAHHRSKRLSLTVSDTYYLNCRGTGSGTFNTLQLRGSLGSTVIRATRIFL